MLKLVAVLSVLGLALGLPADPPIFDPAGVIPTNYHETIGIPQADAIKAAEESINFDGSRIVGGSPASLGAYPHFGGLVITLTDSRTSVCGSSLISNNRAVTAARCWWDGMNEASQFVVVLGSTTLFQGGTRITTNQVEMHPRWNPRNFANDIAVITLSWVNYTNTIRNIGLASGNYDYLGAWGWTAGFGVQRDGLGISSNQTLHHAQLQVAANSECIWYFAPIYIDSNLCTNTAPRSAPCLGDAGGPLQVADTLIAIFSYGFIDYCERGYPVVFTRVSSFETWIRGRM